LHQHWSILHCQWRSKFDQRSDDSVPRVAIVWGLALKKKDKLTLRALFGLGGFSCITNIVRLKVLIAYLKKNTSDPTYYLGEVGVWT
jgi:hypothetical protein